MPLFVGGGSGGNRRVLDDFPQGQVREQAAIPSELVLLCHRITWADALSVEPAAVAHRRLGSQKNQ
jgi:hypothetical protein